LTCESQTIFLYLKLWWPFWAVKQNMLPKYTSMDGIDHTCIVSFKSHMHFNLSKLDKIFLLLALVAIFSSGV
jgi:hypothetical protein